MCVVERQASEWLPALRRLFRDLTVVVQNVVADNPSVSLVYDDPIDAVAVAHIVCKQIPAVVVLVVVARDVHTRAIDDKSLIRAAVTRPRHVHVVVLKVLRVVIVAIVVWNVVDVPKDQIASNDHLDLVQ